MKKTILILVVLLATAAAPAVFADTVHVNVTLSSNFHDHTSTATTSLATDGKQDYTFKIAGYTCTLNGSYRGSVPTGCNYTINIASDGTLTGSVAGGSGTNVCTQNVPKACKN